MDFEKSWKAAKVDYKHLTDEKKPDGKKRSGLFTRHKSSVEKSLETADKACAEFDKALEAAGRTPGADLKPVQKLLGAYKTAQEAAQKQMKEYDGVLSDEMKTLNRDDKDILYRAQKLLKKVMETIDAEMDEALTKMVVAYERLEARLAGGEPDPNAREVQQKQKKIAVSVAKALAHVAKLKAELVKNVAVVTVLESEFSSSEVVCHTVVFDVRDLARIREVNLPKNVDMAVDSLLERSRRETMAAAVATPRDAALALKGLNEDLKEIADWAKHGFQ